MYATDPTNRKTADFCRYASKPLINDNLMAKSNQNVFTKQ